MSRRSRRKKKRKLRRQELEFFHAQFSRAFYFANVLERGLVMALLQVDFFAAQKAKAIANQGRGFDRKTFQADYEKFHEEHFSRTMGTLVERIKQFPEISEDLRRRIDDGLAIRNDLAHSFWRKNEEKLLVRAEQDRLASVLVGHQKLFARLHDDLHAAMRPVRKRLGFPDDKVIEAGVEKKLQDMRATANRYSEAT